MGFESKKITEESINHNQYGGGFIFKQVALYVGMFLLGCGIVFIGVKVYGLVGEKIDLFGTYSTGSVQDEMDSLSNTKIVNALIVGVGGEWHRGSYNTDTMIVASYNPRNKDVTMISIPRDLYVKIDEGYYGRINSILQYYLNSRSMSMTGAMEQLKTKVGDIIGQDITYYGLIDFKWFEHIIDTLGGVNVNVPETLIDPSFPIDNFNYGTLRINSGQQIMNGEKALSYARSRHSTSDFDRSRRQQIIIKAVINKLLSLGSLSKIKPLYNDFQATVTTNAGLNDIIKYLPVISKLGEITTVVFQSDCPENLNQMQHGCVLYSPGREAFGGAAVLLPMGATAKSVTNYTQLFRFVNRAIQYPFGDFDKIQLGIYNGIDKNLTTRNISGIGTKLGVELIRNGLNIQTVENNNIKHTNNMLILLTGGLLPSKQLAQYTALMQDVLNIGDIQIVGVDQLANNFSGTIETGVNMMFLVGSNAVATGTSITY